MDYVSATGRRVQGTGYRVQGTSYKFMQFAACSLQPVASLSSCHLVTLEDQLHQPGVFAEVRDDDMRAGGDQRGALIGIERGSMRFVKRDANHQPAGLARRAGFDRPIAE